MSAVSGVPAPELSVRPVAESDCDAIADLFRQNYGDGYLAPEVYDGTWVRRCVYGEAITALAIEFQGEVVAAGALLLNLGDFNDRCGELARLVVTPKLSGHGIGSLLVQALARAADDSLDYAESHARTAHVRSQRMLEENEFLPIGFFPRYVHGEHLVPYARVFGNAADLRRGRAPEVIPEALPLAQFVLDKAGLGAARPADARPLPANREYRLIPLDARSLDALLLARGNQPEVPLLIGNLSFEQGMPAIRRKGAQYLVAVDACGTPAAALGFIPDAVIGIAKAIELVGEDPRALGFLCHEFATRTDASILEVTVSARAPELQKTFAQLGFRPAAYAPAVAFHGSCRTDGLRMVRLQEGYFDLDPLHTRLTAGAQTAAELVRRIFHSEPPAVHL